MYFFLRRAVRCPSRLLLDRYTFLLAHQPLFGIPGLWGCCHVTDGMFAESHLFLPPFANKTRNFTDFV
jgi:hypothetical protein